MKPHLLLSIILMMSIKASLADDLFIAQFENGVISWEDNASNGTYRVEWCSSPTNGRWIQDWSSQMQIAATGGILSVEIPLFFRIVHSPRRVGEMVLVAGGGQPQGPQYNFYMSKYETRNEEFAEFLNNAQSNTNNVRGTNMYFSSGGNVYMDQSQSVIELLFNISKSRLQYNPLNPIGSRYSVYPDYIGHPIVGVSWYGAMKYCNWLTIANGRGEEQRCYKEGMSPTNWHPAHLTWAQFNNNFEDSERLAWVNTFSGYRLPMDNQSATANYYNEYFKAAAWTGTSNTLYSFGRSTCNGQDANYRSSADPFDAYIIATTPCGYYDGSNHGGTFQTRSNANFYGIYDLSGNASEWVTEKPDSYSRYRGGSWNDDSYQTLSSLINGTNPEVASETIGFRVVSTQPE